MDIERAQSATPELLLPRGAFERLVTEGGFDAPSWFLPMRRAAMARFSGKGYPTIDDEDWRFTNTAALAALPFRPVVHPERHGVALEEVEREVIPGLGGHRLVFIDGHFAAELSEVRSEQGVVVGSLAECLAGGDIAVRQNLGRLTEREENPFVALNTAFLKDGAFIYVESGMDAAPVHLIFIQSGAREGLAVHVRNVVYAARGSRCSVIESYLTLNPEAVVTNTVAEVYVDDRAVVEHVKFQHESDRAYHLAAVAVEIGRSGRHRYHSVATGAKLSRTSIHALLAGERVESDLNGLYLVGGEQLADHHMVIEHAQPHGRSEEHFNGILAGRARGVFHGRIRVHADAQKTDAKQTNKNLLLSKDAVANSKPQLEIHADDVKCTHGATVGPLNDDAIFYLRSRGIGLAEARRMMVHSFAQEIVDRIESIPVREHLSRWIARRLEEVPDFDLHD